MIRGRGERSGNHGVKWEIQCQNKNSGKYSVKTSWEDMCENYPQILEELSFE